MNVAERLVRLAGQSGSAGALLRLIGQGSTAEARLVNYSQLTLAAAYVHLQVERGGYIIFARRRVRR